MWLFSDNLFYSAVAVLLLLTFGIVTFFKWKHTYWKRMGIPTIKASIPFGNLKELLFQTKTLGVILQDIYNEAKAKGYKHIGCYFLITPIYIPTDLSIIKQILVKDFDHFVDRGLAEIDEKYDPLSGNLVNLKQEKWRTLRQKLSYAFTSNQMKMMFETMLSSSKNLEDFLESSQSEDLDIKDILTRYTTDTIASCVFGVKCNSVKNPDAEFRRYGKLIFEQTFWNGLRIFILITLPNKVVKLLGIKVTRPNVEKFFMKVVKDEVAYRESNNVSRKDFMDLLIKISKYGTLSEDNAGNKTNHPSLTIDELAAQAFVFFVGGFETSSTTITFALFEIAQNQIIQKTLRNEINKILATYNGNLTYESITEMHYLQSVIDETLRMYPSIPFLNRECTKDYKIPNSNIILKKNTNVLISNLGIQRDPEYYHKPNIFNPDRFSTENIKTRPPYTYLPFGEGPRNCIGLRFGLLQTKIGLITILRDYEVILNQETCTPLIMDPTSPILASKYTIWLNRE